MRAQRGGARATVARVITRFGEPADAEEGGGVDRLWPEIKATTTQHTATVDTAAQQGEGTAVVQ